MKTILRLISLAALFALPLAAQTIYPNVQRSTLLVSTRVPFSDSSGRLTDDADLTFVTDTLTATKIVGSTSITDSGLTATRVTFAGTAGLLSDDADLTFATDTLSATKAIHSTSVLVGNGTAANLLSALTVYDTGTSLPRGISNVQVSTGTDSANFSGYKARGVPGTLTTVVTGDILTNIRAWGYDGANYINSGSIRWTSEGTIASTRVPSKAEIMVGTDAAPTVLTTTASFSGKDGISLTAIGSNQSITATPSGTGQFIIPGSGTQTLYGYRDGTVAGWFTASASGGAGIYFNGTVSAAIQTASAVTLSVSGGAAAGITGGAGSMTITSGTGNSRTMTLRTTTSGGTPTNFMVADATQGITAGSLAGTGSRAVLADANGLLSAPVSDELWKEPLRPLPESYGVETVMRLQPAIFKYRDKSRFGQQDYIGFGARATAAVLPEVTGKDRDGTYYLTDEKLTAVLVKAVQQQQATIGLIQESGNADWWARAIAIAALIIAIRANLKRNNT